MKLVITMLLAVLTFSQAYAVDGYKSLKFGMSEKEVRESGFCTFKKLEGTSGREYLKSTYCLDFKFQGKNTRAFIYFMNKKFLRLIIEIDYNDTEILYGVLHTKYGQSSPLKKEVDLQPKSAKVVCSFDEDTVFIVIRPQIYPRYAAYLGYSDYTYDKILKDYQKKAIADDI